MTKIIILYKLRQSHRRNKGIKMIVSVETDNYPSLPKIVICTLSFLIMKG
jgi:hypothetical protein